MSMMVMRAKVRKINILCMLEHISGTAVLLQYIQLVLVITWVASSMAGLSVDWRYCYSQEYDIYNYPATDNTHTNLACE